MSIHHIWIILFASKLGCRLVWKTVALGVDLLWSKSPSTCYVGAVAGFRFCSI